MKWKPIVFRVPHLFCEASERFYLFCTAGQQQIRKVDGRVGLSQKNMNTCFKLFGLVLLVTARTSSEDTCTSGPNDEKCNYVVNHSFCESSLPPEDLEGKNTLEEVHTYAELKNDPHSNLPDSFTICSTIMDTNCQSWGWPMFFNVLDNQNKQLVAPFLTTSLESGLSMYVSTWSPSIFNKIPPTFPNQWTKSCLAVNSTSGSIT